MFPCKALEKNFRITSWRVSLSGGALDKIFIEVPFFQKPPPPPPLSLHPLVLKNFWLHTCTQALFFLQNAHLKYLTMFWICLSPKLLSNLCSDLMLFTASDASKILAYSALCFLQIYAGILRHYSGIFRHIQHPVELSHIHNLAIFWTLACFKPEAYLNSVKRGAGIFIVLP